MDMSKYPHSQLTCTPDGRIILNYSKIPACILGMDEEGVAEFNAIVDYLRDQGYKRLIRTPSGGICIAPEGLSRLPGFDVRPASSLIEITAVIPSGCYRIQFRRRFEKDEKEISGSASFRCLSSICKNHFGFNIGELRISTEEGLAEKSKIEAPRIDITPGIENLTFEDVHHLDIHSSHMAGVAFAFPELDGPIRYCYERRKQNKVYKSILTHTWGYMQSGFAPMYYQMSHLSRAGIEYTNRTIDDLTRRLEDAGRVVLMHNTDGIWYGGEVYHGEGEGNDLGQWTNDHVHCKWRAKTKGVYEYMENGKYTVVARGRFELDRKKPRENWEWGDIYSTEKVIEWRFDETTEHIEEV